MQKAGFLTTRLICFRVCKIVLTEVSLKCMRFLIISMYKKRKWVKKQRPLLNLKFRTYSTFQCDFHLFDTIYVEKTKALLTCAADLCFCFRIYVNSRFSHDVANICLQTRMALPIHDFCPIILCVVT